MGIKKQKLMNRCDWCQGDPLYQAYHDQEWGVPCFDNQTLFEFLILEGMQAGLSWITVLRKRAAIKAALADLNPKQLMTFTDKEIQRALKNPGIIRSRLKLEAAVTNARVIMLLDEKGIQLSDMLWDFVDGKPLQNNWQTQSEIPASTTISTQMAKELKRLKLRFVGPTICYALMQAVGMVNDHLVDCFRYHECKELASAKTQK